MGQKRFIPRPFSALYPFFRVLILFSAFYPFFRVLSLFPRFILFSAFYPFFRVLSFFSRVLSFFPRFIPFSAFYPFFRPPQFPYFRNSGSVFYPNPTSTASSSISSATVLEAHGFGGLTILTNRNTQFQLKVAIYRGIGVRKQRLHLHEHYPA